MNNAALQAVISQFGKRIKIIKCSGHIVVVNCPFLSTAMKFTTDDIEFKTYGGTDFFIAQEINTKTGTAQLDLIPTDSIVKIVVTADEKDAVDVYRV
jgi:hypothetical protein